jgi:Ca-activated chloride channel family protein
VVLDAPWADDGEQAAARRFVRYMRSSAVQDRVVDYGFRPVSPGTRPEGPLFAVDDYGVDPAAKVVEPPVPDAEVLALLRDQWSDQRRRARVLLVTDTAGPDVADAVADALDLLGGADEIGLWTVAEGEVVPVGPVSSDLAASLSAALRDLRPPDDGDLYAATEQVYEAAALAYDPDRINAVVVLTDGTSENDDDGLDDLLATATATDERQPAEPVRVFTLAYGEDADADALRQIANATDAAHYDVPAPDSLDRTVSELFSNF